MPKTIIFSGNMFKIVQWEGRPWVIFEAAVRAPGVRLLIVGEQSGVSGLWMTRELRRESSGWDLRLPGGKVFDSLAEFRAAEPTRSRSMLSYRQSERGERRLDFTQEYLNLFRFLMRELWLTGISTILWFGILWWQTKSSKNPK